MANLDEIEKILIDIQAEIQGLMAAVRINPNQILITSGLSDISKQLGLIRAGEFRSGNEKEPGDGFSGVRIAYPPVWYNGLWWNIVGLNNDNLTFGIRSLDGSALFAGGNAVLNEDGMILRGLFYGIKHYAENSSGDRRTGSFGMVLREGNNIPALNLAFEGPPSGGDLITNGGGEAGDLTGWTDGDSAWDISEDSYLATYAFRHDAAVTTYPGKLTQTLNGLFAEAYYTISFANKLSYGEFTPYIKLVWKNAGGTTLRTDTIFGTNQNTWASHSQSFKSPAATYSVVIELWPGDPFGDAAFDSISFKLAGIFSAIYFTPDFVYTGRSFVVGTNDLPTSTVDGFLYIPVMHGTPTGVPDTHTGTVPIVYDVDNNKIYVYNSGWVGVTLS